MEYNIENNMLVAKLDDGEDLFESLDKIMGEIEQDSAFVIGAIGMLKDFKIGFYDKESGEYRWEEFSEAKELLSLKGSITADNTVHLHVQVAGEDHEVYGGHLEGGEVFNVTELSMFVFDDIELLRKRDAELDTDLLSVR